MGEAGGRVSAERWNAMMSIFGDAVELPPDAVSYTHLTLPTNREV